MKYMLKIDWNVSELEMCELKTLKKKLDLTLIQKDVEKFEKKVKTAEKDFEKKFKMLKRKFDQIEELRKN